MTNRVATSQCQRRLALMWFVGSGFVFVVLLIQSLRGTKYGDQVSEAWEWFLPTIIPTLSLIIGVLVLTANSGFQERYVDRFMFRLTYWLSMVYLITVASTVLAQPFTGMDALALMKLSNLWLAPFQGLVTASLGAFFVAGKEGG